MYVFTNPSNNCLWTGLQNLCLHPALVGWSSIKNKGWTDHPETITSISVCWKYIRIIYFSTMLPPAPNTQKRILLTINCWEHWHRPIKALFTCDWVVYKAMHLDVMLVNDVNNLITVFLILLLLIVISLIECVHCSSTGWTLSRYWCVTCSSQSFTFI